MLLAAIGPVIAWRRATASNLRRNLGRPALTGLVVLVVLLALGVTSSVTALIMFTFAGFVFGTVVQEFWRGVRARRAVARESVPVALVALVKRNRRRYGGYIVHVGIVVLFVGVAASSSFKDVRDVALEPGQTAQVGGYEFTYVKPTSELVAAPNGRLERIVLGAQLRVNGKTLQHLQGLLPVAGHVARTGLALLRRRGDQRGRAGREPAQGHLGRGRARHRQAAPAHRGGRPPVRERA